MRRYFKLSHHDFYLKLSQQVEKISSMTNSQEIVEYTETAIKLANPRLDITKPCPAIIKLSKVLNYDLVLDPSAVRTFRAHLINHPSFTKSLSSSIKDDYPKLKDAEKAISSLTYNPKVSAPLRHDALESFEQMTWIVRWKRSEFLSQADLAWLKSEASRLMCEGKVDLFQISLIYEELCKKSLIYEELQSYFEEIISSYTLSLVPDDLLRVLRANWLVHHKSTNESKLKDSFALFDLDRLSEYSISQFSAFFLYTYSCKFALKQEIIDKAESCLTKFRDPFQFYVYIEFNHIQLTEDLIKKIAGNWNNQEKITLLKILIDRQCNYRIANEVLKLIEVEFSIDDLICCSDLLSSQKRLALAGFECLMKMQRIVDRFDLTQLAGFLDILIRLPGFWRDVGEEIVEKLGKVFLNKVGKLDFKKFDTFAQSFSEVFPYKPAHLFLCKAICDSEKPDRLESIKNPNKFYLKQDENFLIYENTILSEMTFTQLIITFKSLTSHFEIDNELILIIQKYSEVLLRKYFFNADNKLRLKLIEVICDKRIYEPHLAELFMQKATKLLELNENLNQVQAFDNCFKKLNEIGYEHPSLSTLLGKISSL